MRAKLAKNFGLFRRYTGGNPYGLSPENLLGRARMLTWIFALASQEDPAPGGGGVDFKITRLKRFARKKSGLKKIQRFW